MHALDITIIVLYFILMIVVGWVVAKLAARSPESYFLAGKSLPWWMIGIAHGSSGIDISGTMWFVMVMFVYGVKGVWLLWVWPLFNVIFRMVYLGTWVRRSNVLTGAEWMRTRFGYGRGAELAYISIVAYAIVSVIPFLCLAFKGIGKFTASFLPVESLGLSATALPWGMTPASFWAIIIMSVTGVYCVVGGMYSVVMNDLIQFTLIVVAAIVIGIVAIVSTTPEQIAAAVPAGWDQMFFGWKIDLDWSTVNLPALNEKLYAAFGRGGDGYSLFGVFVLVLFFKGVLVSMAGPTPNYAIQHVLSTRSPREAALENMMMAICSLAPRFLLIAGVAVLGIVFFGNDLEVMAQGKMDREEILPRVVHGYVPIGCKGLILAGLLAAFMSTFVSTVNSGTAYIVNDIYKRYINPTRIGQAVRRPRLHLLRPAHSPGYRVRPDHQFRALDHPNPGLRHRAGLRRPERPQVALVAVQRLRLLRRHGRGNGFRAGAAAPEQEGIHGPPWAGPAQPASRLRGVPHHRRLEHHRLGRRLPSDTPGNG